MSAWPAGKNERKEEFHLGQDHLVICRGVLKGVRPILIKTIVLSQQCAAKFKIEKLHI